MAKHAWATKIKDCLFIERGADKRNSPNSYQDFIKILLPICQQLAYLVFRGVFRIANQIGESLWSYQKYPAKSVVKQGK
jgi:hypothetical protein